MSLNDAVTSRGLAQRIKRVLPTIQQNFFKQRALLALVKARNQVKYRGSHTEYEWYIRREPSNQNPNWGGGNLAVRSFEEVQVANRAYLPYCWLEKTYGISDKSIEANRHAGRDKIYDQVKENLVIATIAIYNTFGDTIYAGAGTGEVPSGLKLTIGNAYESGSATTVTALAAYAGRTLTTAGVSAYNASRTSMGWDDIQFAPTVASVHEVPAGIRHATTPKWSLDCVQDLAWMADEMSVTADVSGTGKQIKPDIALMNRDPWNALKAKLAINQTLYNVPVGSEPLLLAGWRNIQVDTLTCIRDTDVPDDTNTTPLERVFVLSSNAAHICTTHTKSEGLIKNEFEGNEKNPIISGAIGVLKINLNFMWSSPTAVGCFLGCND